MRITSILGVAGLFVVSACSSEGATGAPARSAVQSAARADRGQAFGLVVRTASCWMGGLWADALGEKYDARTAGIENRCEAVLRAMDTTPEESYELLRSVDPKLVDGLSTKVAEVASRDPADKPHSADLVALLHRVADASRETMRARHAADQVKEDAAAQPAPPSYAADKNAAGPLLEQSAAMRALFDDRGPYADEARTLGLLVALDRMEVSRGLPKHLKLDAVRDAYSLVFGVEALPVTGAPADRAPPGVWLGYLDGVAKASHHPVPQDVTRLPDRETLAWTGVLEGFADDLRVTSAFGAPETPLGQVVRGVVTRLDDEFDTARKLQLARR